MIETLRIENVAIVERAELEFGPGLNVLTGETCAGKSMVLCALELLAGGRASPELLREGCESATVEAVFRSEVFAVFATRLWLLMALIEEMAIMRLDERLADLLVARGPVIRATHQALADELGTAREVVSRILEHFEADGLVRLRRAHVEVLEPRRLAEAYGDGSAGLSSPLDC